MARKVGSSSPARGTHAKGTMEEPRCGVDVENVMLSAAQGKLRLTTEVV